MTTVTRHIHFTNRSRQKIVVLTPPTEPPPEPTGRIPRISKLMALAIRFDQLLHEGQVANQSELARLAHVTQPRMTQIMNLLHLAPNIQEEILHLPPTAVGKAPINERMLRPICVQADWRMQRRLWWSFRLKAGTMETAQPSAGVRQSRDATRTVTP